MGPITERSLPAPLTAGRAAAATAANADSTNGGSDCGGGHDASAAREGSRRGL